ncbi:hypothetical protein BGZ83_005965 [Gryganskiella cystojenkinii]|nr:hypothetical protein BGZ83_005965 [Gryganskiella cystojenkinii]
MPATPTMSTTPPSSTPKKMTTKEIVKDLEELSERLNLFAASSPYFLVSLLPYVVATLTELKSQDLETKGPLDRIFHQWRVLLTAMIPCLGLMLPIVIKKVQTRRRRMAAHGSVNCSAQFWSCPFRSASNKNESNAFLLPLTKPSAVVYEKTGEQRKPMTVVARCTNLDPRSTKNKNPKKSKGYDLYVRGLLLWMVLVGITPFMGLNNMREQSLSVTAAPESSSPVSLLSAPNGAECVQDPHIQEAFGMTTGTMDLSWDEIQAMVRAADEDIVMDSEWSMPSDYDEFDDNDDDPESTVAIRTGPTTVLAKSLHDPETVQDQAETSLLSSSSFSDDGCPGQEEDQVTSNQSSSIYKYVPVLSELWAFLLSVTLGASLLGLEQYRTQTHDEIAVYDQRLLARRGPGALKVHKRAMYKANRLSYWSSRIFGCLGLFSLGVDICRGTWTMDLSQHLFYGWSALCYSSFWMSKHRLVVPSVEEEEREGQEETTDV